MNHQYSCPFSVTPFVLLTPQKIHSIHIKYVVPEGFFFFSKRKGKQISQTVSGGGD